MRLEYFDANGRAMWLRNLLDYCKVDYEDLRLERPKFFEYKKAGKYTYG